MPDPAPKPPAEDVLSSIRRLVSENIPDRPRGACSTLSRGPGPRPVAPANDAARERAQTGAPRLVLSPAQRIETRPDVSEAPMPADTEQALRSAAVVSLRRETAPPQVRRSDPPPLDAQSPSAEDRSPRTRPDADPAGTSSPDPSPQSAPMAEEHNSDGHPRDGGLGRSLAGDIFLGRFSGDPKPPAAQELKRHDATPREGSETAVPMPETGKSLEALEAELLATLDPWGSVQYPKPLPERLVQPAPVGRDAESEDEHGDSGATALPDSVAEATDAGPVEDAAGTDAVDVLVEPEDPAPAKELERSVLRAGATVEDQGEDEGEDEGYKEDGDILRAAAVTAPSPADEGAEAPESPDDATEDSNGAIGAAGAEIATDDAPLPIGAISPDCATSELPVAADADARAILTAGDPPVDVASLRELVAEIVHQELQGALGDRITRNVRQLVRREIRRALTLQQLE